MTAYVVGLEATDERHPALDWACAVAGREDRILAVHAWEVPVVTGYETVAAVDTTAIAESAQAFLETVVAERADPRISARIVSGHPGRAIVDVVEEVAGESAGVGSSAVTAVVGHAGSGKIGLLLGSTANYVIRHARASTVVVRGEVRLPVRRVVVGVDDPVEGHPDEPSLAALRWALALPGTERVEVHHAAFVPGISAGPVATPAVESEEELAVLEAQLRTAIAAAVGDQAAAASGAEIVPVVTGGTGAFDLIEASRTADLVVVGTRGHSGLRDLFTGSTTLEVTAHARCPVVVAR